VHAKVSGGAVLSRLRHSAPPILKLGTRQRRMVGQFDAQLLHPRRKSLRISLNMALMSPRDGPDVLQKRQTSCRYRQSNSYVGVAINTVKNIVSS